MKIAVVGVTGLVGQEILKVLEERMIIPDLFLPVASEKSVGRVVNFAGKEYTVMDVQEAIKQKPDYAVFSAGSETSLRWANEFVKAGTIVIDNSSAWRMHPDIALVIPEVNGHILNQDTRIIANPNCSTIQMLMALFPIYRQYGIRKIVVSTYQSVSGSGYKGISQLEEEQKGNTQSRYYKHPIHENCLPQCDDFNEDGYTREEMKLVLETHKIFGDDTIDIAATAVRVPVRGGHSESVYIETEQEIDLPSIRGVLKQTPGIVVQDDPENSVYPMPIHTRGKDDVFVGRLRYAGRGRNAVSMWIVADNLRKGAATNAVQILQLLRQMGL